MATNSTNRHFLDDVSDVVDSEKRAAKAAECPSTQAEVVDVVLLKQHHSSTSYGHSHRMAGFSDTSASTSIDRSGGPRLGKGGQTGTLATTYQHCCRRVGECSRRLLLTARPFAQNGHGMVPQHHSVGAAAPMRDRSDRSLFGPSELYQNPKKQTLLPTTENNSTIQVTLISSQLARMYLSLLCMHFSRNRI